MERDRSSAEEDEDSESSWGLEDTCLILNETIVYGKN